MFYVFARYRYPLVPFLLLFAAAGLVLALAFDRRRHSPRRGAPARRRPSWLAVAMAANWPILSSTLMRAITENNLGTALQDSSATTRRSSTTGSARWRSRPITRPPTTTSARHCAPPAGWTKRWSSIARRSTLKPDFPSASYNLANALLAQGHERGASAEQFQKTLAISPQSVEAHNNLGIALAAKGDTPGAMAAFRAALAIDEPVGAGASQSRQHADRRWRAPRAIAHLERAIALAPNEPDAIYDIGTVLLEDQNDSRRPRPRFETALTIKPESAGSPQQSRHRARVTRHTWREALTHFERALQLRPDFADAQRNRDQPGAPKK